MTNLFIKQVLDMGQPPEGLLSQIMRADYQGSQVSVLILCIGIMVITVIAAGTVFPSPVLAVNCAECQHKMDSEEICHNPLCSNSASYCDKPQEDDVVCQPDAVQQGGRQVPPWLLNLSREVTRDEDSRPNIDEVLSQQNIDRPRLSFRDTETAATTLQRLLEIRQQHFIISYYFSVGEENIELHLAVAVDHSGTIFVLSSYGSDWSDITQVDSDDIMDELGLSNERFDPPRERMIVNRLARTTPRIVPTVLQPVIEEDESNLAK